MSGWVKFLLFIQQRIYNTCLSGWFNIIWNGIATTNSLGIHCCKNDDNLNLINKTNRYCRKSLQTHFPVNLKYINYLYYFMKRKWINLHNVPDIIIISIKLLCEIICRLVKWKKSTTVIMVLLKGLIFNVHLVLPSWLTRSIVEVCNGILIT